MTVEQRPQGVFDFDGTLVFCDVAAYQERARLFFCTTTGLSFSAYDQLAVVAENQLRRKISREADTIGWMFQGQNTAPAGADHILFQQGLARELGILLMNERGYKASVLSAPDPNDATAWDKFIGNLYRFCYSTDEIHLRPELVDAFAELKEKFGINIVTNSKIVNVQRIFTREAPDLLETVGLFGSAQKFVIDQGWDYVCMKLKIPGFPREVLTRRKNYFAVLEKVRENGPISFVAGDIFELDLALLEALKKADPNYAQVLLFFMQTAFSREFQWYEEQYFQSGKNEGRFLVNSLSEIAKRT